ncbi:retention module-containing protein, partial [Shewanella submarina]
MGTYTTPKAGLLKYVNGEIVIQNSSTEQSLEAGERVQAGTNLSISDDTQFVLLLDDGTEITEKDIQPPVEQASADDASLQAEIDAIQRQIEEGSDPTEELPDTQAGQATQGHSGYVSIDRTGQSTQAKAGFDTSGLNQESDLRVEDTGFNSVVRAELTLTFDTPPVTGDTTPVITGSSNAAPGSIITLVITDSEGNQQTVTTVVGPDGNFAVEVPAPLPEGPYIVDGTVTDPDNNTGSGNFTGVVDTTAPTVAISITEDSNNDGFINDQELEGDIQILVTLGEGTRVGDNLVVTDQAGNVLFSGPVTQEMLDSGLTLSMPAPATGSQISVTATVTDPVGNVASNSDSATLDYGSSAPTAPTVVIDTDTNNDGYINDDELDGQINVSITFGEGTEVGDNVVITDQDGNVIYSGPVTQDMLDNGLQVAIDPPPTGTTLVIDVTVTDPAGNTAEGSDSATLDYGSGTGAPAAPVVVITEDANNDGYINASELDGEIDFTVTLGAGTEVGDTIEVTDQNGNVIFSGTVTQEMLDNGLSLSVPAANGPLEITATVTDPAGNSASGSDSAIVSVVDPQEPNDPIVTIDEDANNDGYINDDELDGQVNITVTLASGTEVGDTITVTDQDGNVIFSGPVTQNMLDNGLQLAIDPPASGTTLEITATITDPAGNTFTGSDSATLDYGSGDGAPAAPTVNIVDDVNNDGYINGDELDGNIDVEITLGSGTEVGDTVIVTDQDGNVIFEGTVTQDMLDNGLTVSFPAPAPGTDLEVTATVTDPAGNSAEGSDSATLDYGSTAPSAPTVTIEDDTNNDGVINDAELDGQINISVNLGAGTAVGDTVQVTDQDGNVLYTGPVTQDMLDNGLSLTIDVPPSGTTLEITATVTDPAGNTAEGSDSALLDYSGNPPGPAAPTVQITEDTNNDGYINDAELDGQINISVTLSSDTEIGDTIEVTDQDGNVIFSGTVTQDMLDNGIALLIDPPATGTNLVITATVTTPSGNTASGSDNALLDYGSGSGAPASPTVTITEDANNDGYINDAELNGQINYQVTLGAGTQVGDTITVTDQDGNQLYSGPVTQDMLDNGLQLTMDPPASGTTLVITATVTDPAGNSASGNDSAILDYGSGTGAPASPTVSIDNDANNDGYINGDELGTQIDITIEMGDGTEVGDTITVVDQNGNVIFTGPVTQEMLDNGLQLSIDPPPTGTDLTITATVTDPAGNSAVGSDSATLDYGDTAPSSPTLTITEDANNDGYINDSELSGQVDYSITLGAGTSVGDTITVTDQDGNVVYSAVVTQEMLDNGLTLSVDAPPTGTNLQLTATVTDVAGNTASGSDSALLDYGSGTGAPAAPTVVITEDSNNDGTITNDELDGQIDVSITLGAGTAVGDTVTVTDQDGNVIYTGVVTQDMLDNGLTVAVNVPPSGTNLIVTATVTDTAGNSASGSDSAVLDYTETPAPQAPTVVLETDANNDGYISEDELNGGQVNITVTLADDAQVGDTLVVTDQDGNVIFDGTVTQDMLDNGLPLSIDPPATGTQLEVTATITDANGNSAAGSDNAVLDYGSSAPSSPTVTITEDTNDDGFINDAELNGQIDITVSLGAGTAVGDTIVVTDQDGNTLYDGPVTQDMLDNGLQLSVQTPPSGTTLEITAEVTDPAGNSASGSDSAILDYGTDAPSSPTVVLTTDSNNDGYISDDELDGGQVAIDVTLGDGTQVGDTIVVTDQDGTVIFEGTVTQEMLDNGLQLNIDPPATGTNLEVTATVTDPAGNIANGSDSATLDYGSGAPTSPTVVITEDSNNDGYINDGELAGQVDISVTLGAGTAVGDTIVITDQDGNVLFEGSVTQDMLDNGVDLAIDPPATGTTLEITATITDPAGNTAEGSDSATLDYGVGSGAPAAPTVTIDEDANNDGFINNAELDGQIDITVTLGAGTAVGDALIVTDQDGNELFNGTVTQAMLDNGLQLAIDAPATGTTLTVTATVTDPAGNTANGNDSATLDYGSSAPTAPTVVITDDANNDGYIDGTELDGQIDISITLGSGTEVGDAITVTDQDGNVIFEGTVTQDMLDNGLDLTVNPPASGTTLEVTATVEDPAGNSAQGSDSATILDTPAGPSVQITEDANNDGYINSDELDGQVGILVQLSSDTQVGDTLVVMANGVEIFNGTVTQDMLDNGLSLETAPLPTGETLTVTATLTDVAGNTSQGSDSATFDYGDTAPSAPTVTITEDANDDGYINDAELDGQVNITVTLATGTEVGDTIEVTDQDGNVIFSGPVTQEMLDNGLDLSIDPPATGTELDITATVTDSAGNSAEGTDSATLDYGVGTGAPAAPTVVIDEDANNDGYINDTELDGDINITVTLGAGTAVGDTLIVTDQDGNELFNGTVTQAMLDNGVP